MEAHLGSRREVRLSAPCSRLKLVGEKGDLKEDPIFGPNLIALLKSNISEIEVKQIIKNQLKRDGKSYQKLKERINLKTK